MISTNTTNLFIKSSFAGFIAQSSYLATSYILDKHIGMKLSNTIGLIICGIIDFISATYIFTGHLNTNYLISLKFIISIVVANGACIVLFNKLLDYIKKRYPTFYQTHITHFVEI